MAFAVNLYADDQTERRIRRIWQDLHEAGIASRMWVNGARPHLTLALFEQLDTDLGQLVLERFAAGLRVIPVYMPSIGVFPAPESVVYLAVTVTDQLLTVHSLFHQYFYGLGRSPWKLYVPGLWVPHFTLARDLAPSLVPRAVEVCVDAWSSLRGVLVEIGIDEFEPTAHVYSFPLPVRDPAAGEGNERFEGG